MRPGREVVNDLLPRSQPSSLVIPVSVRIVYLNLPLRALKDSQLPGLVHHASYAVQGQTVRLE